MTEMKDDRTGLYKLASIAVDDWLKLHEGERFDLDRICRDLVVTQDAKKRKLIAIKLHDLVRNGKLEKLDRYYNILINIKEIEWWNTGEGDFLDIEYPWSHDDQTYFKFRDYLQVSPGDIHVLAGVSNMGKSCYAMNFLWENMYRFPCQMLVNEYSPAKFHRRAKRMAWADPMDEDGKAHFTLKECHSGWASQIQPDAINIIDWINLDDNFFSIGSIIERIQSKLGKGMALIVLQKSPAKELGLGGGFGLHMASLYISLDFERLTVIKAKEWQSKNPNNTMYRFTIVEGGSQFHDIHQIKKCVPCHGTGQKQSQPCDTCGGKGILDVQD